MGVWDAVKGIGKGLLGAAGPIGGIASSVIDAVSQSHANRANAQNVADQNKFNKEQADTQYQRGVKDMEAAGLNPGLAYQQGGDSPATAGAAQAQPLTQNTTSKFATALDTYQALANGSAQRELLREQANSAAQQARLTQIQGTVLAPEGILAQDTSVGGYRESYFKRRMAEEAGKTFTAHRTPERFAADLANIGAGTAQAQAAANESRTRATLNEQGFQNEWFRKNLSPYINSSAKAIDLFRGVKNLSQ